MIQIVKLSPVTRFQNWLGVNVCKQMASCFLAMELEFVLDAIDLLGEGLDGFGGSRLIPIRVIYSLSSIAFIGRWLIS